MATKHYLSYLQETMHTNWDGLAMTDLDGENRYTYAELAAAIAKLHCTWKEIGIKEGDKIALCGRNCANWGLLFLAIESYKAVVVNILPDFTADGIGFISAIIDISTKSMQRNATFSLPFGAGNFCTAESAAEHNLNT